MNGVGKVRSLQTLQLNRLNLNHNGAGRFELALKAKRLNGNFTGIGRLVVYALQLLTLPFILFIPRTV